MATRTFDTTAEQDAAIAWRAAQLGVPEAAIVGRFASEALTGLVAAYLDAEGARVYEAFKQAPADQQAAAKAALGLDGK
jgi:hypothetical protein